MRGILFLFAFHEEVKLKMEEGRMNAKEFDCYFRAGLSTLCRLKIEFILFKRNNLNLLAGKNML